MSSSSPVPSMHNATTAEDGDIVQENNGVVSLVNMIKSTSCRSSLSSSFEAVILNDAGEEEENVMGQQQVMMNNNDVQLLMNRFKEASQRGQEEVEAFFAELRKTPHLLNTFLKLTKTQQGANLSSDTFVHQQHQGGAAEPYGNIRGREMQFAPKRRKEAALITERDALAEKLRDRETQLAEEREKMAKIATERDASAEQLVEERKKMAKIVAERDAYAEESLDLETQMVKEGLKSATLLAEERQKVATLGAERDALAEKLRDREKELAEERQKSATLTTERDAVAEQLRHQVTKLAEEYQKWVTISVSAEKDAFEEKSRDRETKIEELNNEIQKLTKQSEKQTVLPLELDESSGQILFRMANFKAFAEGCGPEEVYSKPVEYINGLPWQINIEYNNEWIGLFLNCNVDKKDKAWQCQAAFKISIISSTKSDGCHEGNLDEFDLFSAAVNNTWGWPEFAKIEKLMDPKNGFYDVEEDTLTFKAELIVKELKGMAAIRTEHTLLVNGKMVRVNKYLLAAHSTFFQNLFFGANTEAVPKVLIENDEEVTMAHFERMISTMVPLNLELDDESVAGVLLLANRFQLGSVVNRCVNFLLTKSKKSAIVKFRLAHECDLFGMKEKLLADMTKDDFAGKNFVDNLSVTKKLGVEAVQELTKRHTELFGTE